jgi:hypothetical protein
MVQTLREKVLLRTGPRQKLMRSNKPILWVGLIIFMDSVVYFHIYGKKFSMKQMNMQLMSLKALRLQKATVDYCFLFCSSTTSANCQPHGSEAAGCAR